MAEIISDFSPPSIGVANGNWRAAKITAAMRSQFRRIDVANRPSFTAWYLNADRQERKRRGFASLLCLLSAALFLVASGLRFFRDERRLDDSGEPGVEIFVGLGGGAESYLPGTLVRVASPRRSEEATVLPASEVHCSGPVKFECDL